MIVPPLPLNVAVLLPCVVPKFYPSNRHRRARHAGVGDKPEITTAA